MINSAEPVEDKVPYQVVSCAGSDAGGPAMSFRPHEPPGVLHSSTTEPA
jgi:hypothetical protein